MTDAELLGYAAATCVFVTFYMKTMVPLRIAGIVSNFLFIGYGYAVGAHPVLILHLVLLPLNIIRLRQMISLRTAIAKKNSAQRKVRIRQPCGVRLNI